MAGGNQFRVNWLKMLTRLPFDRHGGINQPGARRSGSTLQLCEGGDEAVLQRLTALQKSVALADQPVEMPCRIRHFVAFSGQCSDGRLLPLYFILHLLDLRIEWMR
ncbi:MAG TPA: hypothetical protein VFK79_13790 [Xanthobacteraceae bacterium]|nr:hypothetical protein [Xanthobacteraceae bacterium]